MAERVLFKETLDKIKASVSLQEIISSFGYPCPSHEVHMSCMFHTEKTASLRVYDPLKGDGSWYCFGCGKGGDSLRFVQELEKMTASEALALLATRFNIEPVTVEQVNAVVSRVENALHPFKKKKPLWDAYQKRCSAIFQELTDSKLFLPEELKRFWEAAQDLEEKLQDTTENWRQDWINQLTDQAEMMKETKLEEQEDGQGNLRQP